MTSDAPLFRIDGELLAAGTPAFAAALSRAHGAAPRPRCMCTPDGVEMYVAAHGHAFILKRMPNSGCSHDIDCMSYEAAAELTGLGQVIGTAIREDPDTGLVRLRLDFALHRTPGRAAPVPGVGPGERARSDGARLSLKGLLHYLWDQSGLTRWHPGFRNRRSWATVRRLLSNAAHGKLTGGAALSEALFIPEPFAAEHKDSIRSRRLRRWASIAVSATSARRPLILLVAEVKELTPARYGFKLVVKHLPDQPLSIDAGLMKRISKVYGPLLELWNVAEDTRVLMAGTIDIGDSGAPSVAELGLMAVTDQWIPIEDAQEAELVDRLVGEQRAFIKCLRYNLPSSRPLACALLTDTPSPPQALHIAASDDRDVDVSGPAGRPWTWFADEGAMPALPMLRERGRSAAPGAAQAV